MNDISVLPACQARECSHIIFQSYQHAKHMNAHKYDSVTIYFSDIVHFIQMVEESTPAEVIWDFLENNNIKSLFQMVTFLNSFYKMFDSRLSKYDIFKVDWSCGNIIDGFSSKNDL